MITKQGSILIVDDNSVTRHLLCRRLERKGYHVTVAEDQKQALDLVKPNDFDLVLLDIMTPSIDGIEVLKTLRGTHSAAELPVIMVTATDQNETIVEALNIGANDYVTKPIHFPVVLARIQTQLSLKRAAEALRTSEERYTLAVHGANDGVWDWNLKTNELVFSNRWKSMLGYEEGEISSHPDEWFNRVHPDDIEKVKGAIAAHFEGVSSHYETEHRMLHKDGIYRWVLNRGLAVRDANGKPYRMAGSQTDITEKVVFDALTGLPNRLLFMDRLERLIERTKRHEDCLFAVLLLDLDGFKAINQNLGPLIGNQLLITVARRLEACLRCGDTVARPGGGQTLARLGGDEFIIILDEIKQVSDATRVAERLQKEVALPFNLDGREVLTTVSIGITLSVTGCGQPADFLREVEVALHRAKSRGKACHEVFDTATHAHVVGRLQLERDLRRAIEHGEFVICYQPIVSLETGRITGSEALLRWRHPERGLIDPIEFIPVAEETRVILPIGEWLLQTACAQNKAWQNAGYSHLQIAVNFTAHQFQHHNLMQWIEQVLNETGMPPHTLQLEITESVAMRNLDFSIATLKALSAMRARISIDDFGVGYSSLGYLVRFPINTLKIDRSFMTDMTTDFHQTGIIRAILAMAHSLNLTVVAEGVETKEQAAFLRSQQCDEIQGYLFSPPVEAEVFTQLLEEGKCLLLNP